MVVKVWSIAEKLLCLQMSAIPPAAAIGGAVGALALSALLVFLLWFCIFRRKNASRTSESGSSDPSTQGTLITYKTNLSLLTFLDDVFRKKKCCNGLVNERSKKF